MASDESQVPQIDGPFPTNMDKSEGNSTTDTGNQVVENTENIPPRTGSNGESNITGILGARSVLQKQRKMAAPMATVSSYPGLENVSVSQSQASVTQPISPLMTADDYWRSLPSNLVFGRDDNVDEDDLWTDPPQQNVNMNDDQFGFDLMDVGSIGNPTGFPGLNDLGEPADGQSESLAQPKPQETEVKPAEATSKPDVAQNDTEPLDLIKVFDAQARNRQVEAAGASINDNLAALTNQTWTQTKNTDMKALYGKYPRPKNTVLHKVDVNASIYAALSSKVRSRDLKVKTLQSAFAAAGVALTQALDCANNQVMTGNLNIEGLEPIIDTLLDGLTFVGYGNEQANNLRRDMMKGSWQEKYRDLVRTQPSDLMSDQLFGDNLQDKLRYMDQAAKLAAGRSFHPFYRGRGGYRGRSGYRGRYRYNPAGRGNFSGGNQNFLGNRSYSSVHSHDIMKQESLAFVSLLHAVFHSDLSCDNDNDDYVYRERPVSAVESPATAATMDIRSRGPEAELQEPRQQQQVIASTVSNLVGELGPIDIYKWPEFEAGRMAECSIIWESWTSDRHILEAIYGYEIPFDDWPVQNRIPFNPRFSVAENAFLDRKMIELIRAKVVETCEHTDGEYISTIFLRPKKKEGEFRLILNLKGLNKDVEYRHFKMDTIETALHLVTPGCSMESIDIRDAYFSVRVHPKHRKFLRFYYKKQLYQFTCLPQGLSSAPRLFTKLLKVPMSHLRDHENVTASAYIDDILVLASCPFECHRAARVTAETLQAGGLMISPKSKLTPDTVIEHIGFVIDSVKMSVSLPVDKIDKLKLHISDILAKSRLRIREVAQLLGRLEATRPGNKFATLFTRRLNILLNRELARHNYDYEAQMELTRRVRIDLDWWLHNLSTVEAPIYQSEPDETVYTDASTLGWGVYLPDSDTRFGGRWSESEAVNHINVLELMAILFALKAAFWDLMNVHIRVYTDNMTAKLCIENQGSVKSIPCNDVTRDIWDWAIERQIWISTAHIPGILNIDADEESRERHEDNEWKLKPSLFRDICRRFGQPDMDLFASRLNYQMKPFCSWKPDPEAAVIDSFTLPWTEFLGYAFPPFSIVSRVIQKIRMEQADIILVVPNWTTAAWYNVFRQLMISEPFYITLYPDVLSLSCSERIHPLAQGRTQLVAAKLSGRATS